MPFRQVVCFLPFARCMFCLRMVAPSKFVSKLYNPLYSLYAGRGSRQLVAGVAVLVIVFEQ